jgi:MFS family permease
MQLFDSPSKTPTSDAPDHFLSQDDQRIDRAISHPPINRIHYPNGNSSPDTSQPTAEDEHSHHDRCYSDHEDYQNGKLIKPQPGFGPVLKNFNFLGLWSGQVFSQLADKVYLVLMIAIIASVFQQPGQSISSWVSAIMIAFTIPAILFGYLAGAFVDRWQKKTVLVLTNLLRGLLVLALPLVLWMSQGLQLGKLPLGFCLMLVITFLVSTLTQFFAPAEQAAIPLLVKRQQLLAANSLYTTTMMASVIIGFAVGEPVLNFANHFLSDWGNGLTIGRELVVGGGYCFAGFVLMWMRIQELPKNQAQESVHVFAEIRDAVAYLGKNRRVRSAMLQLVILFCVFAALAVLAVRLAEVIPNIESEQFGFLLAAGGLGMGIGAAILGHFGSAFTHRQLSLLGSMGMTASLGGLALFSDQLIPVLISITFLGFAAALVGVPMQTTIQAETPEEMRGKVFGLQNNVVNIALSLPLAVAGVAEALVGLQVVFLALAVIVMAGGSLTWYISGKQSGKLSNSR